MSAVPPISRAIPVEPQAYTIARELHEIYERRALDQHAYRPHLWSDLTAAEQRLRAEAVQEMLDGGRLLLMPECDHPEEARALVRREFVLCQQCGLPVSMLRRIARRTN